MMRDQHGSADDWIPENPSFRYDLGSQLLFDHLLGLKPQHFFIFEVNQEDPMKGSSS